MSVSIDEIRNEIARRFEPEDGWAWVREMFVDRAIVEVEAPDEPMLLIEVTWTVPDDGDIEDIELGEPREVELEYVAKAEGGPRLAGPIAAKDATRRIAYAPVLVPGEPDADGEELTREKVADVAHKWLEDFRTFDVQHSLKTIAAAPVESYIEPADRTVQIDGEDVVLPEGTWTVAVKVHDDDTWAEIEDGTRTGLSVMGVPNDQYDLALAALKSGEQPAALKRVTLADVGGGDPNGGWFAPLIGIVDQPAVPKAKFFSFKQAPSSDAKSSKSRRLWDALTGAAGKEGRKFSDQTYQRLIKAQEEVSALVEEAEQERQSRAGKARDQEIEMTPEEVKQLVSESANGAVKAALEGAVKSALDEALDEKLAPITERLDKIDPPGENTNSDAEAEEEEAETVAAAAKEAVKAAVDEHIGSLADRLDTVEKRLRVRSDQPDDDGDDVAPASMKAIDRDAFGRRRDG